MSIDEKNISCLVLKCFLSKCGYKKCLTKMNNAVNNDSRTMVSKIWSFIDFKNIEQKPSVMQQIFSTKINNLHTPFIHQVLI